MSVVKEFELYNTLAIQVSKRFTTAYSTSFSLGIRLFAKPLRDPIYSIYGFVRLADEIVDTWHSLDQKQELDTLEADCKKAINSNFSANPILHAFARVVNLYHLEPELIDAFIASMRLDLTKSSYTLAEYETYIYGSAEVIGLMCLRVFCDGDTAEYERLKPGARALGSAFQKVNFLRDLGADSDSLGRMYFPGTSSTSFSEADKLHIIADIEADFAKALPALNDLPHTARLGVRLAYVYYKELLKKIRRTEASTLRQQRIRVSDPMKICLFASVYTQERLLRRWN